MTLRNISQGLGRELNLRLRIETGGDLLAKAVISFRTGQISCLAEDLSASQKQLCSVELVSHQPVVYRRR